MQCSVIVLGIATLAAGGCVSYRTPSMFAQATAGWAHPWTKHTSSDGMSLDLAVGVGEPGHNSGGGGGFSFRSTGDTQEVALSLHHYEIIPLGKRFAMFGRVSVNLIEWDRVGSDDGGGIGGPSFELGFGANGTGSPCIVASARRDFRFGDRDDTFLGISVGLCALIPARDVPGLLP